MASQFHQLSVIPWGASGQVGGIGLSYVVLVVGHVGGVMEVARVVKFKLHSRCAWLGYGGGERGGGGGGGG